MNTIDSIIKSSNEFYDALKQDKNGRYRSWEHCYFNFMKSRNNSNIDYDYLSLHLAFYLASWGMYRGSSFLLQKDYKIHIPVVKKILDEKYNVLAGVECVKLREKDVQILLKEISDYIVDYYDELRKVNAGHELKNQLSSTLVTKILMGTLGCVPAYDRYFISGIKSEKVSTSNYNLSSLLKLVDFYEDNYSLLEMARMNMDAYGIPYPQMKIIDMAFWEIGFKNDPKNINKISH